jgi:Domain of unknown function (DUF4159)
MKKITTLIFSFFLSISIAGAQQQPGQQYAVKIAKLQYEGGGDWYANPSSLPNLIDFLKTNTNIQVDPQDYVVKPGGTQIFQYPFIHMTGHGNVLFSDAEAENLRKYLIGGGFLHIDDNYGMAEYARREMKKVFPELEFIELPYSHPVYSNHFSFPNGLPKIHEHDGKPAQGFGLIWEERLVCFFSVECDLGDGWEDPDVHNDPEEIRQQALKMGANLVIYALNF